MCSIWSLNERIRWFGTLFNLMTFVNRSHLSDFLLCFWNLLLTCHWSGPVPLTDVSLGTSWSFNARAGINRGEVSHLFPYVIFKPFPSDFDTFSCFLEFSGVNLYSDKSFDLFLIGFTFVLWKWVVPIVKELLVLLPFISHGHQTKVRWPDWASDSNLLQPLSQPMVGQLDLNKRLLQGKRTYP